MKTAARRRFEGASEDPFITSAIDGVYRRQSEEDQLDDMIFAFFNNHVGELIMTYLRNLTTNSILPMGASGEQVLYREGSRFVVALLEARRGAGENKQSRRSNES